MNHKTILILAVIIAVSASVVFGATQIQSQTTQTEEQIYCTAMEHETSKWYKTTDQPALSRYVYGAANFSTLPNVELGLLVKNNNTLTLFDVYVTITYNTTKGTPQNVTAKIGSLDIQETKQIKITLTDPQLLIWETKRPNYATSPTTWENVTIPVFDVTACNITVYGHKTP